MLEYLLDKIKHIFLITDQYGQNVSLCFLFSPLTKLTSSIPFRSDPRFSCKPLNYWLFNRLQIQHITEAILEMYGE